MFDPGPCVYMEKLAGGRRDRRLPQPRRAAARRDRAGSPRRKGTDPGDVTGDLLDRQRHEEQIAAIREAGARIRCITDGDVSAALFAVSAEGGVDLLWGIGGTPEGVISAAAIKCLGGQILGRLWPRDDDERKAAIDAGYDLDEVLDADRLVAGDDVFFAATGVTDGDLLQGVRYTGGKASTESLVMRSRSGTVRTVQRAPRPAEAARGHRRALRLRRPRSQARRMTLQTPRSLVAGATGYIGRLLARELASDGRDGPVLWRADRSQGRRPGRRRAARSPRATCSSPTRSGRRSRASTSPTTSSTRWAAGGRQRLRRPRPARRRELRRRRGRGRRRADRLPRRAQRGRLRAPAQPPRDRRGRCSESGVPVTYFRAAAVIGAGSESFRTVLYLVQRLPVMITPTLDRDADPADRDRRRARVT